MSRLVWGSFGERFYETGVDRGVLFIDDNEGVPWNGLVSVSESPSGGSPRPYYLDGIKYANVSSAEEFEATIEAFSSPPEFSPCDGSSQIHNGLFATQQPRKQFSMSYRSLVGNDIEGQDHAYKIHLVYNALAAPSERPNTTLNDSADPTVFSWHISTLPPPITGLKPTSHFVIDSRSTDPAVLAMVEETLYGSDMITSSIPTPDELVALFTS